MAGSCAGCAMSQLTLKQGVESMMKHYCPEVKINKLFTAKMIQRR